MLQHYDFKMENSYCIQLFMKSSYIDDLHMNDNE